MNCNSEKQINFNQKQHVGYFIMGRPKREIDIQTLLEKRGERKTLKKISREMGVSVPTLTRRIADLQYKEGVLTKYREILGLHLTMHQIKVLEAITPEKLEKASLIELLKAYVLLVQMEKKTEGKDGFKIDSLMDHLLWIEKVEKYCAQEEKNRSENQEKESGKVGGLEDHIIQSLEKQK